MKVFISQPMRDRTVNEIVSERQEAMEFIKKINPKAEEINTFFKDIVSYQPLWYLGESIKRMADADIVIFCKNWYRYKGCLIEHECAVKYNKECIYM